MGIVGPRAFVRTAVDLLIMGTIMGATLLMPPPLSCAGICCEIPIFTVIGSIQLLRRFTPVPF